MQVGTIRRFCVLASIFALGAAVTMPARADDETVASPRYAAWAKFKPDSTVTLSADTQMGPNPVHLDMTRTLKSVSADEVKIETSTTATFMGHTNNPQAVGQTIPAKETKQEMKDLGDKDVEAMGKTFKCKAYELSGAAAATLGPGGPHSHAPQAPGGEQTKATIYVCDDVPGGLVKMEIPGPGGKQMTFVMSAMEAK